jgi:hypothetical protein
MSGQPILRYQGECRVSWLVRLFGSVYMTKGPGHRHESLSYSWNYGINNSLLADDWVRFDDRTLGLPLESILWTPTLLDHFLSPKNHPRLSLVFCYPGYPREVGWTPMQCHMRRPGLSSHESGTKNRSLSCTHNCRDKEQLSYWQSCFLESRHDCEHHEDLHQMKEELWRCYNSLCQSPTIWPKVYVMLVGDNEQFVLILVGGLPFDWKCKHRKKSDQGLDLRNCLI